MLSGKNRQKAIELFTNARIKYLPDDDGNYIAKSITVFDRPTFKSEDGWELSDKWDSDPKPKKGEGADPEENRRKAYARAKNNLFDLLLCTPSLNCFVTLTFDGNKVKRDDYGEIVKRLSVWLDNRVRRSKPPLKYVLVPEYHKDGENIHFHGLMNFEALKVVRAVNQKKGSKYYGQPLFDDKGREIYNIADFTLGLTTVIPIDGINGREACAKYCYKYIIKSQGQKVGGRYYLSGGDLGRPRYDFVNMDFDSIDEKSLSIHGFTNMKRINL